MNTATVVAALLAAALLTAPPSRGRLPRASSARRIRPAAVWPMVLLAAAVGVVTLPALSLTAGVVILGIERRRRRSIRTRRRRREGQAIAAALEVLVGELRVGAHPLRAFRIASDESVGRVGASLRSVAHRAQLGADVAAGLQSVAQDSSVPAYWNRLAVYWQLAAEHGLPMSTLMRAAYRDIVARHRFAAILAGLPGVGVALGELIGAHPVRFLLGGGAGGWLLAFGVGLIGIGVTWSDHIIDRLTP